MRRKNELVRDMAVIFLMIPMFYGISQLLCVKHEAEVTIQKWSDESIPTIPSQLVSDANAARADTKEKPVEFTVPICIMGTLYYDWIGRPKGVCIPVLDPEGNPVDCADDIK